MDLGQFISQIKQPAGLWEQIIRKEQSRRQPMEEQIGRLKLAEQAMN